MGIVIKNGFIIGIAMLIVTFAINFISINSGYQSIYENTAIFRSPDDPLMLVYVGFPFVFGFAVAWMWHRIKHEFSAT